MTTKISRADAEEKLRDIIAKIQDMQSKEVLARYKLRGKELGLEEAGVRALSVPINDEFGEYGVAMTPFETQKAETIRDLHNAIWEKIPAQHRQ